MKFYMYKPKQKGSFKVIFKFVHFSSNVDDIKKKLKIIDT
jgi:hypothetical protein